MRHIALSHDLRELVIDDDAERVLLVDHRGDYLAMSLAQFREIGSLRFSVASKDAVRRGKGRSGRVRLVPALSEGGVN